MGTLNEVHINSALQLLQARKEALDRINRTPMRPHGKVLGKDVFTWFDYAIEDLVNTLLSFPFPIHWVAKKADVEAAFHFSKELPEKMETVALYDTAVFQLTDASSVQIKNCIATNSITDTLTMVRAVEHTPSVLLITGQLSDWQQHKQHIETFLETFKNDK